MNEAKSEPGSRTFGFTGSGKEFVFYLESNRGNALEEVLDGGMPCVLKDLWLCREKTDVEMVVVGEGE